MATITVATIANIRVNEHVSAILKTASAIPFPCKKLIISPKRPDIPDDFRWETIPEFSNWTFPKSLNTFLIKRFVDFIDTDLVVYVHDDGFARNPSMWTDEFLFYDYIGAPWPAVWCKDNRVGNGGFSLRSRQLLYMCQLCEATLGTDPEDVYICRTNYNWFMKHKCRFAPVELALRFSFESVLNDYPGWNASTAFGFHGKHLLPR